MRPRPAANLTAMTGFLMASWKAAAAGVGAAGAAYIANQDVRLAVAAGVVVAAGVWFTPNKT